MNTVPQVLLPTPSRVVIVIKTTEDYNGAALEVQQFFAQDRRNLFAKVGFLFLDLGNDTNAVITAFVEANNLVGNQTNMWILSNEEGQDSEEYIEHEDGATQDVMIIEAAEEHANNVRSFTSLSQLFDMFYEESDDFFGWIVNNNHDNNVELGIEILYDHDNQDPEDVTNRSDKLLNYLENSDHPRPFVFSHNNDLYDKIEIFTAGPDEGDFYDQSLIFIDFDFDDNAVTNAVNQYRENIDQENNEQQTQTEEGVVFVATEYTEFRWKNIINNAEVVIE